MAVYGHRMPPSCVSLLAPELCVQPADSSTALDCALHAWLCTGDAVVPLNSPPLWHHHFMRCGFDVLFAVHRATTP